MKELKEMFYVVLAVVAVLILLHWIGQGIAWSKERNDRQRAICIQETKNPAFCQVEW